jgi:hypothetical protein
VPKVSVYLADELWEQVRTRAQDDNAGVSQVIQAALKQMLVADFRPAFAQSPPPIPDEIAARLRERFTSGARATYQAGFRAGLRFAERLSWPLLEDLAIASWDLRQWVAEVPTVKEVLSEFKSADEGEPDVLSPDWDWGSAIDDVFSLESSSASSRTRLSLRQGFLDALRWTWELVWETAPPPDVSEPESKPGDATTGTDADRRADVQTRIERQPHTAGWKTVCR